MKTQKDVFLNEEGDRWFQRNQTALAPVALIESVEKYIRPQHRILEIGCSLGRNLEHFRSKTGCEAHGIEPSAEAVKKSAEVFPKLHVKQGTADSLPYEDKSFDVVYFGFCLYLVDRGLLMKTFAEADRVLKDNSFLIITDFDCAQNIKVPYAHYPGMFSYRSDYARMLTAFHYTLAEKVPFSHSGSEFHTDPFERVAHQVFFKDLDKSYFQPKRD